KRDEAVEIYALYLKALQMMLIKNKKYSELIKYQLEILRRKIFSNPYDINLVLVFIFLPELCSRQEWEKLFLKLMGTNYLPWGGLSSLSLNHPNFQKYHTGENSASYHSGDSWYYLNNLFALALSKVNYKKFKNYIEIILQNSIIDLLLDGALGFSSEVSSAQNRSSKGSPVQLWSMASLLRLLQDINIFLEPLRDSHNIITIKAQ
ncbi:MAG: hypothetical protein NZ822_01890, partial [Patescibacteria group bacterium]|nr:hypothetical protein [Patescibacteria group bacterium]